MSNPETKTPPTIAELAAANDHIGIWIEMKRNAAAEALAKFQAKLAKDPAYAMEWGSDAIEAAGWMKVLAALDHARREGYAVERIAAEALRMVLQGAKYPPSSTSAISNLTALAVTAAWTHTLEFFEQEVRRAVEKAGA